MYCKLQVVLLGVLIKYYYSTGSTDEILAKLEPVHDLTNYSTDKKRAKLKPKRNTWYKLVLQYYVLRYRYYTW